MGFSFFHFTEQEIQSVDENGRGTIDSAFNWKIQNRKTNQLEKA